MSDRIAEAAPLVSPDDWSALRSLSPARLALGRAGAALPTAEVLRFGLDQARARDAVHRRLEIASLLAELDAAGLGALAGGPTCCVHSAAPDRHTYLRRPDLGRRLAADDEAQLSAAAGAALDLCFVLADGLSAAAVQYHAVPLLQAFYAATGERWANSRLVLAEQARVALGDVIGECLAGRVVVVLIGERPGLSSPDSLGIYLTLAPRVGRSDAERNCISNVRPAGLSYPEAARRLAWLLDAAIELGCSGVALKERSDETLAGPADEGRER